MNNLENLGVVELSKNEVKEVEGGAYNEVTQILNSRVWCVFCWIDILSE